MERKAAIYNPALLKIFDEILVNAANNKQRSPDMSHIHVSISYDLQDELVEASPWTSIRPSASTSLS
jgi:hypothetical protein